MAYNVISINDGASATAITAINSGRVADIILNGDSNNANDLSQVFNGHTTPVSVGAYLPVGSVISNNSGSTVLIVVNDAI